MAGHHSQAEQVADSVYLKSAHGWGDDSDGKALNLQTRGPELNPQNL